jgi:hypothetical protein
MDLYINIKESFSNNCIYWLDLEHLRLLNAAGRFSTVSLLLLLKFCAFGPAVSGAEALEVAGSAVLCGPLTAG